MSTEQFKCKECGLMFTGAAYAPEQQPVVCPNADSHDNVVSKEKAAEILAGSRGRFLTIEFTKRTTGESRQMTCRTGVTKHLKGGKKAYDATAHGLAVVWETKSKEYRSVPLDAITALSWKGKRVVVR
jgi:hypothetical protein